MRIEKAYSGGTCDVYFLLDHRGRSDVQDMDDDAHKDEQKKFFARVRTLADHEPQDSPHCSLIDSKHDIWQLKAGKHIRVCFVWHGRTVVLLNALRKTKKPTDPHFLKRACQLKAKYDRERGRSDK